MMAAPRRSAPLLLLLLLGACGLIAQAAAFEITLPDRDAAAAASAVENFIPASDPSVWFTGRTVINDDGSRSFDWEGTQLWVNLEGATYVKMIMNHADDAKITGRFSVEANDVEVSLVSVGGCGTPAVCEGRSNEILVAQGLGGNTTIRAISILEPAFENASPTEALQFVGWKTDGTVLPPTPRKRKIELLGDSISAGYGSRGDAALHAANVCPVNQNTCGNKYTYNWKIAEHFDADIVPIAWSGKGMYQNCCDDGERMPAYWLQTLGGGEFTTDWDHSRYVPDMLVINLGTNDFGHDAGPAWERSFSATYTEFVLNATRIYNKPKLPIFVAQGPMNNSPQLWGALNASINAINAAGGNAVYLDLKGPPNDGCGGHPGVLGHEGMAEMAYPQIAKVMGW